MTMLEQIIVSAQELSAEQQARVLQYIAQIRGQSVVPDESEEESIRPGDTPPGEHWGQRLARQLELLGPLDLAHPEIEDPTEWVKQIRRDAEKQRGLDWRNDDL